MTDKRASDELKILALEMINNAGSGHSGSVLSMTDALYTLYTRHVFTNGTKHQLRDRVVLSAGHACAALYAVLAGVGYLNFEDLKTFRQNKGMLTGHPEIEIEPIDCATGPLGQGVANAVGMAIAETIMNERFGESHHTYCVAGDGCLQEGVALEALSIAGLYNLNKFILLYDKNNVTLDGELSRSNTDDFKQKFRAMNFNVLECDGYNIEKIDRAIIKAKQSKNKPTVIILNTIIGRGTSLENSNKSHGVVYDIEEIEELKKIDKNTNKKLEISDEAKIYLKLKREEINSKFTEKISKFTENLNKDKQKLKKYNHFIDNTKKYKVKLLGGKDENRKINNYVLNQLSSQQDNIVTLSADLSSSTKVMVNDGGNYSSQNRLGKNIAVGIREHAMGAIANGIALHGGLVPVTSTFLVFANYMLPAVRMAAIMNLPVIFTFSHSTPYEMKDGITHVPVEQLDQLRLIPNLNVFRPFDMVECVAAYDWFYTNKKPMCLCISKNKIEQVNSSEDMSKGAYFLTKDKATINLMAGGSDVAIAIEVKGELKKVGIVANVISMLSLEVFDAQPGSVRAKFLNKPLYVIESSTAMKYLRYTWQAHMFNINKFGITGDGDAMKNHYGIDVKTIVNKIKKSVNKN